MAYTPGTRVFSGRAPLREGDPRRVGSYRLTDRLGSGGMGVVYLGVGEDGRLVAVKVMRPELADSPEFRARFSREVAVLTRIRGVRNVRVIEAGDDACGPFMVTEYAAGPSLAGQVEAVGPLEAGALYELAAGLAEALSTIHAAGVVHRDLKPSNVIMTADGPKVIDFGIAQVLDSVSLTGTGITIGSTGFMAPEQIEGHAGQAADIFAWALNLAYAASGELPFGTGPTAAVLYRVLNGQPDLSAVPDALRPVVEAALAKNPQDRPAAHEIVDQLAAIPAGESWSSASLPTVLSPGWSSTEPQTSRVGHRLSPVSERIPQPAGPWHRLPGRRAAIAVPVVVLAVVVALALVWVTGRSSKVGHQAAPPAAPAVTFGTYPGQQDRGMFETISRIVASGNTIVTTGAQVSNGITRQQFLVSADGGATWQLAQVRRPGGGQAPLGYPATRLAGGRQAGWRSARRPSGQAGTAGPGPWRPPTGSVRYCPATRCTCWPPPRPGSWRLARRPRPAAPPRRSSGPHRTA